MSVAKEVNSEPIPGYRLIERLGSGGFGEVWKCEAPGGLFKAIKFVFGDLNAVGGAGARAEGELPAVHRVKAMRHPFLLSMDRVECLDGELVIVMELADQNLHELWVRYRQARKAGLPRGELLGYLREAAEVLDLMNVQLQLQHLDIKPHNLFLVSNHVKVGDFGLVSSLSVRPDGTGPPHLGAITPLYASPELFLGQPSRFSDQYSLAIVYQELLTGRLPFRGKNARQLLFQHTTQAPDLQGLSPADCKIIARALAKEPEERFPTCADFIASLQASGEPSANAPAAAAPALSETRFDQRLTDTVAPPRIVPAPAVALAGFRDNLTKVMREIMIALGRTSAQDPALAPPRLSYDKDVLRYRFRAGLALRPACAKLDSFCAQCFGQMIREDERGRGFTVPMPSSSWSQWSGRQPALEVHIVLDRVERLAPLPIEIAAELRALGCGKQGGARLLREMGLPLLDSLRAHILVHSEKPAQERLSWTPSFKVRALYADGRQGEMLDCRGKDISLSGIGFFLPRELDASEVLIDFPSANQPAAISIPATLVRARRCPDGTYEVGALFRLPAPVAAPVSR
jgi:hypothetical protein